MQAVILAAGQGTRLRPLTDHRPKCLVEVQGKPMLQYQLEALSAAGVRECIMVVGHRAQQVRTYFGRSFRGVSITYVENEIYDRTNNIYSLWLARDRVTDDMLLLEGDLIYEPELIIDLLDLPGQDAAVVDTFQPFMNGTVIPARGQTAESMVLKRDQPLGFDYRNALKTVNMYRFSRQTVSKLMPALGKYVAEGLTDNYYEMVIAEAVTDGSIRLDVLRTGLRDWAEVDTPEDLADAENMRLWQRFIPSIGTATSAGPPPRR